MGYIIKTLNNSKRAWKVQFRTEKDGKRRERDIPDTEFRRLGFRSDMSIEEAKQRKDQLNAIAHVKDVEAKRMAISRRLDKEEKVLDGFLSRDDVKEFETHYLFSGDQEAITRNKVDSHWRKARRILFDLKIEPKDWAFFKKRFYDRFIKERLSPSYVQKLIAILNQWGTFQARKYGFFFDRLPFPTGYDKEKIADAYFENDEKGCESDPITPDLLESVKDKIMPEWYNWFYLSVWFGLRPMEVDQLLKPEGARTWIIGVGKGVKYLAVYQSKLRSIARDKRTKLIPCLTKEQEFGLEIIREGKFNRPSHGRHFKPYFGENVTLYGGRKGFQQLMHSLGQDLEDIASWMGHQSIERTWKNYKDKQVLNFKPVKKQ